MQFIGLTTMNLQIMQVKFHSFMNSFLLYMSRQSSDFGSSCVYSFCFISSAMANFSSSLSLIEQSFCIILRGSTKVDYFLITCSPEVSSASLAFAFVKATCTRLSGCNFTIFSPDSSSLYLKGLKYFTSHYFSESLFPGWRFSYFGGSSQS